MLAISITSFKHLYGAGCDVSFSSQNIVLLVSTKPIIIIIIIIIIIKIETGVQQEVKYDTEI